MSQVKRLRTGESKGYRDFLGRSEYFPEFSLSLQIPVEVYKGTPTSGKE